MSENVPSNPDPLARFRARESTSIGAALAGDPTLLEVALAWVHSDVSLVLPESPPPLGSPRDLWEWFWAGSEYDPGEVAELAGMSVNDTRIALRRLKGLCMIYPDGTLTTALATVLTARANRSAVEVL